MVKDRVPDKENSLRPHGQWTDAEKDRVVMLE